MMPGELVEIFRGALLAAADAAKRLPAGSVTKEEAMRICDEAGWAYIEREIEKKAATAHQ